jgi:hypothetical protein
MYLTAGTYVNNVAGAYSGVVNAFDSAADAGLFPLTIPGDPANTWTKTMPTPGFDRSR